MELKHLLEDNLKEKIGTSCRGQAGVMGRQIDSHKLIEVLKNDSLIKVLLFLKLTDK